MNFFIFGESRTEYRAQENNFQKKILGFLDRPNGWHYGEGIPPKFRTITNVFKISDIAQMYDFEIDASLGANGEIEVDCYNNNDTLEFIIEENQKVTYVLEREGQEEEYIENLSINEATDKLTNYIKNVCDTLERFTEITTTGREEDSRAWRLKIPLETAEFQLFPCPA